MANLFNRVWGEANALLKRPRQFGWADVLVLAAVGGVVFGLSHMARQVTSVLRPAVEINLSPSSLPKYTWMSLSRGIAAYVLSLGFTLVYGYWAAKDKLAERVLIPLLDILQSIPVLGFLPGVELAMIALFPHSNLGLELTVVLMIFTSQAWNMTFSFYHSLKNLPLDMREVATTYRFSWRERLEKVEVPFATIGLVWNSMMSMAGGWFFLTACETFRAQDHDFRLPGLGSYMQEAANQGNAGAQAWAVLAMVLMIVGVDQLIWRPVVVWSQKFRVEEGGAADDMSSLGPGLVSAARDCLRGWANASKRGERVLPSLVLSKPPLRPRHRAGSPVSWQGLRRCSSWH